MTPSLEDFKKGIHRATLKLKNHEMHIEQESEFKLPLGMTSYYHRTPKKKIKALDEIPEPTEQELAVIEMTE